jgi:FtsH-binding integral membrane protein
MTVPVALSSNVATRVGVLRRRSDHAFFTAMSILMAVGVGAGFSRTYFARIAAGTTTPLIHVHGAVFAVWMLLFILQAVLVAVGKTRWHRRVGVAGVFFAVVMLVIGTITGVIAARHGYRGPFPSDDSPLAFLLFAPIRDMLVFGTLTGAAIVLRRDVDTHKRLMVMATLGGLVPAGFVRIAGAAIGIPLVLALLFAGPVYDWLTHRRIYGSYIWGIAVTLLSSAVFELLGRTAAWQSFAQTLVE